MGINVITLSPDVQRFVGRQVKTGQYASEEEAGGGEFVEFTAEDIIREGHAHLEADNKNP